MSQSQCPDLDLVFIVMRTPVIIIIAVLSIKPGPAPSLSSGDYSAPNDLLPGWDRGHVGNNITLTTFIRGVTPAFLVPLCLWDNSQFVPDDLWALTLTLSTLADWPSLAPPSARPPAAWGPSCPGTSSWPRVWPRVSAGARVWAGATCHDHSGDGMYPTWLFWKLWRLFSCVPDVVCCRSTGQRASVSLQWICSFKLR